MKLDGYYEHLFEYYAQEYELFFFIEKCGKDYALTCNGKLFAVCRDKAEIQNCLSCFDAGFFRGQKSGR